MAADDVGTELDAAFEARLCPRCGRADPMDFGAQLVCSGCGATWQADVVTEKRR